ncbi:BnaC09g38200D [Brassica napus]|uniref:BnaC09g38200D protein n=1 Tax=Brassica napus TaxID=3708 RepID=A0A078FLN9_BRANA|nr:BnaC09g38200D [Brassica napus]
MSISILCFCFVLILPCVYSLHFKITRFNQDSPEIAYQGEARANGADSSVGSRDRQAFGFHYTLLLQG